MKSFYNGAATIYKLNIWNMQAMILDNFFIRITAHKKFFSNFLTKW